MTLAEPQHPKSFAWYDVPIHDERPECKGPLTAFDYPYCQCAACGDVVQRSTAEWLRAKAADDAFERSYVARDRDGRRRRASRVRRPAMLWLPGVDRTPAPRGPDARTLDVLARARTPIGVAIAASFVVGLGALLRSLEGHWYLARVPRAAREMLTSAGLKPSRMLGRRVWVLT